MRKASLERYAERKQPLVFLYNCTIGLPLHHSRKISEESRAFMSQVLQPLLQAPERVQGVWKVCLHSAWLEQNTRDWDGAQGGHITGASSGYKARCLTWRSAVMLLPMCPVASPGSAILIGNAKIRRPTALKDEPQTAHAPTATCLPQALTSTAKFRGCCSSLHELAVLVAGMYKPVGSRTITGPARWPRSCVQRTVTYRSAQMHAAAGLEHHIE
ncbi:unnamed protein product [Symbiodinium natans]|uniref:Uncharacterized protein n=1 Tax=Symbiodinium natans TaxID=878477 RepID=A0A812IBW2_9DINO|nr:unnamed protein product [Symbiodinium natans]